MHMQKEIKGSVYICFALNDITWIKKLSSSSKTNSTSPWYSTNENLLSKQILRRTQFWIKTKDFFSKIEVKTCPTRFEKNKTFTPNIN